ncbi:hypothetical protein ACTXT7_000661 [Hymenolepis weldensis]
MLKTKKVFDFSKKTRNFEIPNLTYSTESTKPSMPKQQSISKSYLAGHQKNQSPCPYCGGWYLQKHFSSKQHVQDDASCQCPNLGMPSQPSLIWVRHLTF